MMTRRNKILGWFAAVTACLLISACADSFLTEDPPHIIVADNLYTDVSGFEAGLNGLYAQVRMERMGVPRGAGLSRVNEIMNMMWSIGVDNGYGNYPASVERIFNEWGIRNNPLESLYLVVWTWLYETINASNTIINRAENPDVDWTEEDKNRIVAEARLIRAWAYRHLTYLWGDVPLNLEESSGASVRTDWERAPIEQVRAQMEEDLVFAEEHLDYVGSVGRVNKAVAQHFLAELYLAMNRPGEAETKARAVIEQSPYSLITARYGVRADQPGVPFMDQFYDGNVLPQQGNTEALWVFPYEFEVAGGGENIMRRYWVNRYYTLRGVQVSPENGGRGIGRLAPTGWSLDIYEPNDDRGSEYAIRWFYIYNDPSSLPNGVQLGDTLWTQYSVLGETLQNPIWPSTRKWDWTNPNDISGEGQWGDQPYIRLAETYLLLAEAQWAQGNTPGAAETINVLRRRANASEISASDVTLDFILDERSRELLTEEHRRYTLVRTGTWLRRVQAYNGLASATASERDVLFPIPQVVIDANLSMPMRQNQGY